MAGILSGLASLGLGNLENKKIFEKEKKNSEENDKARKMEVEEKDFIYDKKFECPVCDSQFSCKIVKTGKAKLLQTDMDLRPKYEGIDMVKYDVVLCPTCGFAALTRYFKGLTSTQIKAIKENISVNVHLHNFNGDIYTYEEAIERYKLTLACAVVKRAKASEKAYICLKSAWLLRGYGESLKKSKENQEKIAQLAAEEKEYLKNAYEGFIEARQSEQFPICGMDEMTTDYLIAVLAYQFKKYDVASRLTATIITSASANTRMKEKARDLKEMILADIKKIKGEG